MSLSTKRVLNSFTTAAAAQAESMRCLAGEAERYARDCTILALQELRAKAAAKGVKLENYDVAEVFSTIFPDGMESRAVLTTVHQAKKRQAHRNRHKDPFASVNTTLKTLRGMANASETKG